MGAKRFRVKVVDVSWVAECVQYRPTALLERHLLPQGIGNHQDIGENDRTIEAETAEFLKNLDNAMSTDSKFAEKVRQLERFYDQELDPSSDEDVKAWFERQDLEID